MPVRTYMQVDDRRDHSFTIPRPDLSRSLGVPNACVQCHGDQAGKDDSWASEQLSKWGVSSNKDHWANVSYRADIGDVLVTRELTRLVDEATLPGIVRASLLQQIAAFPSRMSVETAQRGLQDDDPMVRRAAVIALEALPSEARWQLLSPYLKDKNRSVRFQLAETLEDLLAQLSSIDQSELEKVIREYRQALAVTADSPATQTSLAMLERRIGDARAAEKAYLQALRIEPNYVPALLNMADYYRSNEQDSEAEVLLRRALLVAPDSGAVQYSYGLLSIRKHQYDLALFHLELATLQYDAQARYTYVYAAALDDRGKTKQAVKILVDATQRWPNDFDLLMMLIFYLEKTGSTDSIYKYISRLSAVAPAAPEVKRLVKKYSR
jgi:tetratricopeptide (TPR) repeat protein